MSTATEHSARHTANPDGTILIEDVRMQFRTRDGLGIQALENTSLSIPGGQFVSVLGPSGCGKSTLMRIIAGLIAPTGGTVRIGDEEIHGPSRHVGIAFQSPVLLPWYTVAQNIALPGRLGRGKDRVNGSSERVSELLDMVKLGGLGDKYPRELSGGMRQRVAIARALITRPSVILMDEPFGALDALTREHMHDELLAIWERSGATVFFITHDITEAVYLSDRVLVMSPRPGRVVADVEVDLPRPRGEQTRESAEYAHLAGQLRHWIEH